LPFIDRSRERRPWKRPIAMGAFALVLAAMVAMGALSFWQDSHDPAVATQIKKQHEETAQYMKAPFKPTSTGVLQPAASTTSTNPAVLTGKTIFTGQGCNSCHGDGGVGTSMAPSLVGIRSKFANDQLATIIRHPPPNISAGGMPSFKLSDSQMQSLLEYLDSLKQ